MKFGTIHVIMCLSTCPCAHLCECLHRVHACASVYTEFCGTFLVVHVYIDMTEHSTSDMPIRVHKHQCVNRVCKLKKKSISSCTCLHIYTNMPICMSAHMLMHMSTHMSIPASIDTTIPIAVLNLTADGNATHALDRPQLDRP